MATKLHENIQKCLDDVGISPEAASKLAGLDRGYLQKLLERPDASPRAETLEKIAGVFGLTTAELIEGKPPMVYNARARQSGGRVELRIKGSDEVLSLRAAHLRPAEINLPPRTSMPNDIPVMGTAAGSHLRGAFQLTNEPIDFLRRPPALAGARDIYGLYIIGDSMFPQYPAGEPVIVSPHKPPLFGDAVIVQCKLNEEADIEATIGIFTKRTEKHITIGKHNPKADVNILRSTVVAIHKVLTLSEILGM